jgi:FkbM family methyltransferase
MANVIKLLNMPEYIYQPGASLRRVFGRETGTGSMIVQLPWGLQIEVDLGEAIGRALCHHGLFEISVVEAIFRLTDPSDIFLDVGANIGFMSAAAVSANAREIYSFEPHPALFDRLSRNIAMWEKARPAIAGRVQCMQVAISEKPGHTTLYIPSGFNTNKGISSLEAGAGEVPGLTLDVRATTLDEIIGERSIGILKIDIEGHELKAFAASRKTLDAGRVRDIIFEDFEGMTSRVARLLSEAGYTLFGLNKTVFGPALLDTEDRVRRFRSFSNESRNFLATLDPDRARSRMMKRGYRCLAKQGRSAANSFRRLP